MCLLQKLHFSLLKVSLMSIIYIHSTHNIAHIHRHTHSLTDTPSSTDMYYFKVSLRLLLFLRRSAGATYANEIQLTYCLSCSWNIRKQDFVVLKRVTVSAWVSVRVSERACSSEDLMGNHGHRENNINTFF